MTLLRKKPLKRTGFKKPDIGSLLKSGLVSRASSFAAKPRKKLKARSSTNKGWWDVALDIWASRPHICEACRRELGDEPIPHYFSHLLPRGSYRRYKRDPRNIALNCMSCHDEWHRFGPDGLAEEWQWVGLRGRYYELRDEANGI